MKWLRSERKLLMKHIVLLKIQYMYVALSAVTIISSYKNRREISRAKGKSSRYINCLRKLIKTTYICW